MAYIQSTAWIILITVSVSHTNYPYFGKMALIFLFCFSKNSYVSVNFNQEITSSS